ncbi:hypothetical protein LXA43DRAFT_411775 [Ganoderma leucocontextum]|nr:hypothetical protein LXA43DRAFT_411775 [Ganoderma leucocontextum]
MSSLCLSSSCSLFAPALGSIAQSPGSNAPAMTDTHLAFMPGALSCGHATPLSTSVSSLFLDLSRFITTHADPTSCRTLLARAYVQTNHKCSLRRALHPRLSWTTMRPTDGHDSLCPLCLSPASFVGHHQCIHHLYHKLSSFPLHHPLRLEFVSHLLSFCMLDMDCASHSFTLRAVLSGLGLSRLACIPPVLLLFLLSYPTLSFRIPKTLPLLTSAHPSLSDTLDYTLGYSFQFHFLQQLAIFLRTISIRTCPLASSRLRVRCKPRRERI